jgi:RND family efflux transporter MFP subunit
MRTAVLGVLIIGLAAACGRGSADSSAAKPPAQTAGTTLVVRDTTITGSFEAAGVAEPVQRATLSTRLMGSVTQVLVREGDRVTKGQVLARIDARDLQAKRAQVDAGIAGAEAMYQDAQTQAARFRALYADSAATRYQLEQVETGLARAEAGLRNARASRDELNAVGDYAEIRAPFSGIVTQRFVDPGAFAAPGAPIVEVQDASRLRVSVTVAPRVASALRSGQQLEASIEGHPARAVIEGAVPAPAGAVYTVNALVDNQKHDFLPGSSATLRIPDGTRTAILIPAAALVQEGDLTGVKVTVRGTTELRWVKIAGQCSSPAGAGPCVEVLSGLNPGDEIVVGSN